MTDVTRPRLLDCDQVALIVAVIVNRGGVWYMTEEQRKMINKLNEDNRKLNDVNKGLKNYAKYKLVVGILVVIIIIILYFIQHIT